MYQSFDEFTTTAGWTAANGALVYGLNDVPEFVAGLNTSSLLFKFPVGSGTAGGYVQKVYGSPIDVTTWKEIVISIWSRNKRRGEFQMKSDFVYKIDFGTGKEYLLPTPLYFTDFVIPVDFATIDRIRITALHDDEDYVLISHGVLVGDANPIDILNGIAQTIEARLAEVYPIGVPAKGKVNAVSGADTVTIRNLDEFVQRHSVITLKSGATVETHYLDEETDQGTFSMSAEFDGKKMVNNFNQADVYVKIPVTVGMTARQIFLPSITVWGLASSMEFGNLAPVVYHDGWKVDGSAVWERRQGQFREFDVLIDCEARHYETLMDSSEQVRRFLDRNTVWAAGRKHEIFFQDSTETEPAKGWDMVPKVQYRAKIGIREESWQRVNLVPANPATLTFNQVPSGTELPAH